MPSFSGQTKSKCRIAVSAVFAEDESCCDPKSMITDDDDDGVKLKCGEGDSDDTTVIATEEQVVKTIFLLLRMKICW